MVNNWHDKTSFWKFLEVSENCGLITNTWWIQTHDEFYVGKFRNLYQIYVTSQKVKTADVFKNIQNDKQFGLRANKDPVPV